MKKALALVLLIWVTSALSQDQQSPQVWTGTLSDNMCGSSHAPKAAQAKWTDRECLFECIKGLGKYVLVDEGMHVITIANQDAGGIPLYAGKAVKITGRFQNGSIFATKVEAAKGKSE
jgi:hypothetical protein